ncbi:hypothetical protein CERSUDRAFT_62056 [Gelatoporia subvermispora B]|uniref:MYND-type domain-containing protein n=1 Tax=Ceriporiopsis subvermispora (strain B) TaxID=914234 RepID=M2RT42_CERS8|nr:hypothetical protein CERSUDRAFT_62056 [Gelatoporia subvermispora B]
MLNNHAIALAREGHYEDAEQHQLRAIDLKERTYGPDHRSTAVSYNALGELYIKMNRPDDAETFLQRALRIRERHGLPCVFDAAISRENLAQVHEMKGDLGRAKDMRLLGAPNTLVCGWEHCTKETLTEDQLSQCSGCKAIFYCSDSCQRGDWRRHRNYCRRSEETTSVV